MSWEMACPVGPRSGILIARVVSPIGSGIENESPLSAGVGDGAAVAVAAGDGEAGV